jgi:hypothetical protein
MNRTIPDQGPQGRDLPRRPALLLRNVQKSDRSEAIIRCAVTGE